MTARTARLVSVGLTLAVLTAGCGDSDDGGDDQRPRAEADADPTPSASATTGAAGLPTRSEKVDIGGRDLFLECWGEPVDGEPTVLLISGLGPTVGYWQPMAEPFAEEGHHLCGYDRAGVGASDPAPEQRRTTDDQVTELLALLEAAELDGPFVVVAHSLGSLPAVGLVEQAPDLVHGIVFVDPWSPSASAAALSVLPPERPGESEELAAERRLLTEFRADPTQNPERLVIEDCDAAAVRLFEQDGPALGDIPVVVLRQPIPSKPPGIPRAYHEAIVDATLAGVQQFADESTRGTAREVADTGHDIHADQPEAVMEAIREVLAG